MMSLPDFRYKQTIFFRSGENSILRFRADNLVIEDAAGTVALQHSCHRMFALFIIGNITVTNVMLKKAHQFGFPLILLGHNLRPDTVINSPAEGNTLLRMRQYASRLRNHRIACRLIQMKIHNQCELLKCLRYRSGEDDAALIALQSAAPDSAPDRKTLMGIEGNCSKLFFQTYFRTLGWTRREPRCHRDIPNLLLDIGYTLLFNFIDALLALYGFDVYCGVHHTFFYQRKSLVCDLIEPFRCIIDHRLRMAYNLRQISQDDFSCSKGVYSQNFTEQEKYIRLFVKDILERKEDIFLFIQNYYRWFIREKDIGSFPCFNFREDN